MRGDSIQTEWSLDAPTDAGHWGGLVGGTVSRGEMALQAVIREAWEEIGLALNERLLESLPRFSDVDFWSYPLGRDMDCLPLRRQEPSKNLPAGKVEGEGLGWFTAAETADYLPVREQDRQAISEFSGHRGISASFAPSRAHALKGK